MFIVIISFPAIKPGKESEFQEWFVSSNQEFATFKGFIRRRLLKPAEGAATPPSWSLRLARRLKQCTAVMNMTPRVRS